MNRGNLADLTAFIAVADHLSFRVAASRLACQRKSSALSHSMRQLEERLGVRLLHRTTRSVSVSDAGFAPARAAAAGLRRDRRRARGLEPRAPATLGAAADALMRPIGRRRWSSRRGSGDASCRRTRKSTLSSPVGEAPIDIVAKGFDAGIGPHDRAPARRRPSRDCSCSTPGTGRFPPRYAPSST